MDIGRLSAPYLLGPVVAMAQILHVSRPGEEPDPSQPISEDMRLFDPTLANSTGDTSPIYAPASDYPCCN